MTNVLDMAEGDGWSLANGDCVEVLRGLPDKSIGFSIFSPPYLSLFTYSASSRDMSNGASDADFWKHFRFVIDELLRVMMPGRIVAVDVMNVTATISRDGYIGIKDFRGDVIREFRERGFVYHSEHCAWKDPLLAAVRTKALGLAHKTIVKDSSMVRAGLAQYLLAFRAPGKNLVPIPHENGLERFFGENEPTIESCKHDDGRPVNLSHERWRRYASPVWMDIDFSNTLNAREGREEADEAHLCPMALDMIRRGLELWSNPGDIVLSPFAGIGSEGYVSIEMGRRFIGAELKPSYFREAVKNIASAAPNASGKQTSIFDLPAVAEPVDDRPSFGAPTFDLPQPEPFALEPTPPTKRRPRTPKGATVQ